MSNYSSRYVEDYERDSFEKVMVAARRERVLESAAKFPHRRTVEIGCGLEPLFAHLRDFDHFTVVEPSAEFARRARAAAAGDHRIVVLDSRVEDVVDQLALATPDFVVLSSLLHEVAEPELLLAAVRTLCREDTIVHLNVPNVRSFHRLLALEMGLISDLLEASKLEQRFGRHTRYDRETLLRAAKAAGFEVLHSASYFVKPFTHAQMQAMLHNDIIDQRVLTGLNGMTRHMPDFGCELFVEMRRSR